MVGIKEIGKGLVCLGFLWSCETMASDMPQKGWKSMEDVLLFSRFKEAPQDNEIDVHIKNTIEYFADDPQKALAIIWKADFLCGDRLGYLRFRVQETLKQVIDSLKNGDIRHLDIKFAEVLWESLFNKDKNDINQHYCVLNKISSLLINRHDDGAENLKKRIKDEITAFGYGSELVDF
ncbi:MAG: hypothetical protein LBF70_00195 [Holosporales bacterium]|jgi:hypothetical protein|nr:hypothetical protein [Holosporales bacterium]